MSKHQEESWKYDAQWSIFDEIRGVWLANETLSRVPPQFVYYIDKITAHKQPWKVANSDGKRKPDVLKKCSNARDDIDTADQV